MGDPNRRASIALLLLHGTATLAVCPVSGQSSGGKSCPFANRRLDEGSGLLNEGKGCWGHCDLKGGDCAYCGTGQCCRRADYDHGVAGCELARDVVGARCGAWRGLVPG